MVLDNQLQNCNTSEFSEVSLSNFDNEGAEVKEILSNKLSTKFFDCKTAKKNLNNIQVLPPFNGQPTSISDIERLYQLYKGNDQSSRKSRRNILASSPENEKVMIRKSKESVEPKVDQFKSFDAAKDPVPLEAPTNANFKQRQRSKSCSYAFENLNPAAYNSDLINNNNNIINNNNKNKRSHFSADTTTYSDSFVIRTNSDTDLSKFATKSEKSDNEIRDGDTFENWIFRQNEDSDSAFYDFPSEGFRRRQNKHPLLSRRDSLERLLHELYRSSNSRRQSSVCESDTPSENLLCRKGALSPSKYKSAVKYRKHLLLLKDILELRLMHRSLSSLLVSFSSMLVKELKKKDKYQQRNNKQKDVVTAILHALSSKTRKDTRMRFSVEPFAGDSGFTQWHDAMKMCARLPGGIPQEFRRRMWLTLAEQHVRRKNIHWKEAERICFNEWASPDDEGLGDQIVKDLHRTGCSLFCGEEGEVNQILLKRVLLGYARWNKAVGYCQGFNMLAAIILEVMDRQESDSLKVMIYLIEGVLPESYFANNLRGLSVDMAVFRELLRIHLPILSRHLELLQQEAADQATGACYEPPLTNVFTMQWFLTLFSNCLPRDVVMRVWDLTFLHGNEMLLRTALAVWGRFASRIMEVPTADEFYCVMGNLTREMLTYGLMDANQLVQTLIGMAPFPFPGLAALRDKFTYNITPWTMTSVARKGLKIFYLDDDDDDEEKGDHEDVNHTMAVATAFGLAGILRKTSGHLVPSTGQAMQDGRSSPVQGPHSLRPSLDISALKKQYARLRERQRQAHVILTASNIRRKSIDEINKLPSLQKTNQITMKHLLRGKKALTSRTKRVVPQGVIPNIMNKKKQADRKLSDGSVGKSRSSKQSKTTTASSNLSKINTTSKPKKEEISVDPPLSPVAIAHQQLMPKRSLPEEDQVTNLKAANPPPTTIHWKDTPRRVRRRASLPYGVKLMEGVTLPNLPDIKDDDDDDIADEDDSGSSTSTELCDEDLLADLSEEETHVETGTVKRPLSTSPRLEHHQDKGNPEERLTELLKEKPPLVNQLSIPLENTALITLNEAKTETSIPTTDCIIHDVVIAQPVLENIPKISNTLVTEEKSIAEKCKPPTNLEIPEIMASLSLPEPLGSDLSKKSLSSPTKWKWSFSEIENPAIFEPVSPILKLHNFLSDESPKEEQSTPLPPSTPQPEIFIEKESKNAISPVTDDCQVHQRSNIFAYLFEITDVTKLSNVNSEEPSPIEDRDGKLSPILNMEKFKNRILPLGLQATEDLSKIIAPEDQPASSWNEFINSKTKSASNKTVSFQDEVVLLPFEPGSSENNFQFSSSKYDSLLKNSVSSLIQTSSVPKEEIVPNSLPYNISSSALETDILTQKTIYAPNEAMSNTDLLSSFSESTPTTEKKVPFLVDTSLVSSEIYNTTNDTNFYSPNKYKFELVTAVQDNETSLPTFHSSIQADSEVVLCDKSNIFTVLSSSVLDDVAHKRCLLAMTPIPPNTLNLNENKKNEIEDTRLSAVSDNTIENVILDTNVKFPNKNEKTTSTKIGIDLIIENNKASLTSHSENEYATTIQESSNRQNSSSPNQCTPNIKQEKFSNAKADAVVNLVEKELHPDKKELINKLSSSLTVEKEDLNCTSNIIEIQNLKGTPNIKQEIFSNAKVDAVVNLVEKELHPDKKNLINKLSSSLTVEKEDLNCKSNIIEIQNLKGTPNIKQEIFSNAKVDAVVNLVEKELHPDKKELINKLSSSPTVEKEDLNCTSNIIKSTLKGTIYQKETSDLFKNVPKTDNKIDDINEQLVSQVASEDEKDKLISENCQSFSGDTLLENLDSSINSVFVKDKKSDISSLSENNLSLDYFTKSGLGLEEFDIELPPLSHSFKIHPRFKDTPKSKSWDNDISSNFDFSKFKKLKSNHSESFGEATGDKNADSENGESRRCYFSKVLRSLSLESELYEEIVNNTSQNGVEQEEDSELIRRKLWAGVKSLSLDAELLIATNKNQKSCIDFSASSMPALDESPTDGSKENGQNDSHNGIEETPSSIIKSFQKRRKSEAALKLMKENTKIIDKILNQRYDEWLENNSSLISCNEFHNEQDTKFLTRKSSSDHSISECAPTDHNVTTSKTANKDTTCPTNPISEPNTPCKLVILPKKDISITNSSEKIIRQNAIESVPNTEENEALFSRLNNQTSNADKDIIKCTETQGYFSAAKFSETTKQNLSLSSDTGSLHNTNSKAKVTLKSPSTKPNKILLPDQNFKLPDENQQNSTSHSSPVVTSKYFSSILTPEKNDSSNNAKPVLEGSTSTPCPQTAVNVSRNVKCEKKSASRSQSVPFSKLSKLSPKSSLQKGQGDRSLKSQIKLKSAISNSNGISDSEGTESKDTKISPKPQIFNPFPTKPLERPPKDVGVKLGLYSTTKTNNT